MTGARRTTRRAAIALLITTLAWLVWLFTPRPLRAGVDRTVARAAREVRYWASRPRAACGRLLRKGPRSGVADAVLEERVRSSLLALERRLDIRRIHVEVEDHVVILHGEVPSRRSGRCVERAAQRVSGVAGLESYLHVGPIYDGAQPSAGMRYPEASDAKKRLLQAAYDAGAPVETTQRVVRAVLGFLADRIPPDEFDQFAAHLPRDVRAQCYRPTRNGAHRKPVHTVDELVSSVAAATGPLPAGRAEHVIAAVLGTLRDLVPEEDRDIAATLPDDLRGVLRHPPSPLDEARLVGEPRTEATLEPKPGSFGHGSQLP